MIDHSLIQYSDLVKLGYKPYQARRIIRLAKDYLVEHGYAWYNNKRLGLVPVGAVEKIIGFSLLKEDDQ